MMRRALLTLLVCLWTGAVLAIALIGAPAGFAVLADRAMAGAVAGQMFKVEAYGTLMLALLSWMMIRPREALAEVDLKVQVKVQVQWGVWIALLVILIATILGYFVITPQLQDIKLAQGTASAAYAKLHGASMGLYALKALSWLALSGMMIKRLTSL
jgi:Domain of unknown function (DUF4149)